MSPRKRAEGNEQERKRESGEPGGGAGRRDEDVGGSGVYPASAEERPVSAEVRTQGEWGQKLGGEVGGASELNPKELGITEEEEEELGRS